MKRHRDIKGDGGSNIVEQVIQQQGLVDKRMSGIRRVIAVGSAKGGVGKSTVVTQLAHTFADMGYRVAILDADVNGPTQIRLTGLQKAVIVPGKDGLCPPETKSGIAVLSFASLFHQGHSIEFPSIAKGDSHTWRATREFAALRDLLAQTDWGGRDILLVDLPPGAERTVQFMEFLGPSAKLVLVTNPSDVSREVVRRGLAALSETSHEVLGVIENMSGYYCADCNKVQPLFPKTERVTLDVPVLGSIPFEPEVAKRCDDGVSLHEGTALVSSEVFREVGRSILQKTNIAEEIDEVSMRPV